MSVFFHYFDTPEALDQFIATLAGRSDVSAERMSETSVKLYVWSKA